MGNKGSTTLNTKDITTLAVAQAYLTLSQDISQGINAQQMILADCSNGKLKNQCYECIERTKKLGFTPEQIDSICGMECKCTISNVRLSQRIFYNSQIFQDSSTYEKFKNQFENSLYQQAENKSSGLKLQGDETKNVYTQLTSIYNAMRTDTFQSAMEQMKSLQSVVLIGGGKIVDIDMTQAIDYVSRVLQQNSATSSILNSLQISMFQSAVSIVNAGLGQLIVWIVRIVMIIVIIIALFYVINLIFQIYSLYVQK
jgi:hypothetical protein